MKARLLEIVYAPSFVRQYKKLNPNLKEEVKEKIELFKDTNNHERLRVHHLGGNLKGRSSFSVNHQIRIIFKWGTSVEVFFLEVGNHDIYSK